MSYQWIKCDGVVCSRQFLATPKRFALILEHYFVKMTFCGLSLGYKTRCQLLRISSGYSNCNPWGTLVSMVNDLTPICSLNLYRPNIDLTWHVSRSAAVAGAVISVHCHIVLSARPSRRSGTRSWNLSGLPGSRLERRGGGACDGRQVASLYYDIIAECWFLAQASV